MTPFLCILIMFLFPFHQMDELFFISELHSTSENRPTVLGKWPEMLQSVVSLSVF